MGRKKREPTRVHGIRLPNRLWDMLDDTARKEYRSMNALVWKIVEDWLVDNDYLKEDERKR